MTSRSQVVSKWTAKLVKLHILHFRKAPGYLLVYKKTDVDCILLSITGSDKRGNIEKVIPQHPLTINLSGYKNSFVNLNTLVLIENNFFSDLIRKTEQPEKTIKLSQEELMKIKNEIDYWFSNELRSGNLYELRVLPNFPK